MKLARRLIYVTVLLFAGCSHLTRTKVGPTCVSCKPYYCRGSWHHPQTYYEYDEVGLASWYGDQFQDKQKASGEKFDKMSMTAAHKTLPIPSVVRVTNPRNGRSVILVVDDRGPFFYKGRIIDLSYAAAKALDMHKCKPSPVRVQTLVEDSLKLSIYIKHHCKKRKDPMGRTWNQIYMQEIRGGRSEFYMTQTDFGGDANGFSSSAVREYKQTDTQKKSKKQISSLKSDQKTKSEVTANKTVSSQRNKYKNATKKRYNGLGRYIGKL